MAPFDRSHTSSYWRSIVTMALFCITSEIKRDISGRKSRLFIPVRGGGSPSEYFYNVWQGKTRIVDLPDGGKV